ncbi:unnamed protein product, partial [Ixodes pacificus]
KTRLTFWCPADDCGDACGGGVLSSATGRWRPCGGASSGGVGSLATGSGVWNATRCSCGRPPWTTGAAASRPRSFPRCPWRCGGCAPCARTVPGRLASQARSPWGSAGRRSACAIWAKVLKKKISALVFYFIDSTVICRNAFYEKCSRHLGSILPRAWLDWHGTPLPCKGIGFKPHQSTSSFYLLRLF